MDQLILTTIISVRPPKKKPQPYVGEGGIINHRRASRAATARQRSTKVDWNYNKNVQSQQQSQPHQPGQSNGRNLTKYDHGEGFDWFKTVPAPSRLAPRWTRWKTIFCRWDWITDACLWIDSMLRRDRKKKRIRTFVAFCTPYGIEVFRKETTPRFTLSYGGLFSIVMLINIRQTYRFDVAHKHIFACLWRYSNETSLKGKYFPPCFQQTSQHNISINQSHIPSAKSFAIMCPTRANTPFRRAPSALKTRQS